MGQTNGILKIQNEYLRLLESHFQKEREELVATNQSVVGYALNLFSTRSPSLLIPHSTTAISPAEYRMLSLMEEVDEFWRMNAQEFRNQLARSELLVLVVSCMPWTIEELVRQYGVYFDTLCVSCPFYRRARSRLETRLESNRRELNFAYLFRQYVEMIDAMRKLAARCYPPLFVVFPSNYVLSDDEAVSITRNRIQKDDPRLQLIADRFYFHWQKIFEEFLERDFEFEGITEARKLVRERFTTIHKEKLVSLVKLANVGAIDVALRIDDALVGAPSIRVTRDISALKQGKMDPSDIDIETWFIVWDILVTELLATEVTYLDSCYFGTDSCFRPYEWDLYRWKLSGESREIRRSLKLSETEVATYAISKKLQWLSHLPLEAVVEIRCDDSLSFVREMFRGSKKILSGITVEELEDVSDQIANDIKERISGFNSLVVSKKKEFYKSLAKTGSLVAGTCALSIASTVFPRTIPLAITSSVFTIVFGRSAVDLYKEYRAGKRIMEKLNRSPIAFFAEIAEKGQSQKTDK